MMSDVQSSVASGLAQCGISSDDIAKYRESINKLLALLGLPCLDDLVREGITEEDFHVLWFLIMHYSMSKEIERLTFLSYCCRYHFDRVCSFLVHLKNDEGVVRYNSVAMYAIDYLHSATMSGWYIGYRDKYVIGKDYWRFLKRLCDTGKIFVYDLLLEARDENPEYVNIINDMTDESKYSNFVVLEKRSAYARGDFVMMGEYNDVNKCIDALVAMFDRVFINISSQNYDNVIAIIHEAKSKLGEIYYRNKKKA